MRPAHILRLVLLTAVLLTSGCASNNKGKIEGTKWSSLAGTVKGNFLPAGTLQLEFRSDKSLVYGGGPLVYTGTYSLGMGDTVTFHLTKELAGRKDHAQKIVVNGDRLTVTDSDGTQLTFEKVK